MQTSAFEAGLPQSRICLVGESPSWEEVRRNSPFVGNAGQLLDLTLHSAGIARASCYITNVFEVLTKRPESKGSGKITTLDGSQLLWTSTKGFTEAGWEMAQGCLQRINACTANVIVPLGGTALTLCADTRSPTKWRGSIFYGHDRIANRKLVPTIHPSSVLRGVYEHRYFIISDLRKALAESTSPLFTPTPRKLIIDPSHADCVQFLRDVLDSSAAATDIEILGGQIDCFSLAITPHRAISIPMLDHNFESRWSVSDERELWALYAQFLGAANIAKVNQNLLFDLSCLAQLNHIVARGPLRDCMVAFSVMYPFLSKSLGTLVSMLTREPYYKDDGELHDSPSVEDFERRWEYNAKDAACALECWLALQPMLEPEGYAATYDMTMRTLAPLMFMMINGVKLDEPALLAARVEAQKQIANVVARLETAIGRPIIREAPKRVAEKREIAARNAININSPKQLAEHFYHTRGVKAYVNHPGAETTDDLALARIARRDGLPEAKLLQEYRSLDKLLGTYLEVKYDADRRMRCSYNIRGTVFGRLSAQKTIWGTGLQMQNILPSFRGFIVGEDYKTA